MFGKYQIHQHIHIFNILNYKPVLKKKCLWADTVSEVDTVADVFAIISGLFYSAKLLTVTSLLIHDHVCIQNSLF